MGDDSTAPHKEEILFTPSDTVLDLLNAAADYVPVMYDYVWEVMCAKDVLETLSSGSEAEYLVEAFCGDAFVFSLKERKAFCRVKD